MHLFSIFLIQAFIAIRGARLKAKVHGPVGTTDENHALPQQPRPQTEQPPRMEDKKWKVAPLFSNKVFHEMDTKLYPHSGQLGPQNKGDGAECFQGVTELCDWTPSEIRRRNRYGNVLPSRDSIVLLKTTPEKPDKLHGYINANFIDGKEYIATQGPMKNTIEDFWRMVWEQGVENIVMVTGIVEKDVPKCERYWPAGLGEHYAIRTTEGISITTVASNEYDSDGGVPFLRNQSSRTLPYVLTSLVMEYEGVRRTLHHFWYDTWPDMGVPTTPDGKMNWNGVAEMLTTIRGMQSDGPMVVHCSAGIGRTGTVIGIDIGQRQLMENGRTDVHDIIQSMRNGRGGMVQTYEQAEYLHSALLGFADRLSETNGDTDAVSLAASDLKVKVD